MDTREARLAQLVRFVVADLYFEAESGAQDDESPDLAPEWQAWADEAALVLALPS